MPRTTLKWVVTGLVMLLGSVGSALCGDPANGDHRPSLFIVMAEREYHTDQTLPAFAKQNLNDQFRVRLLHANPEDGNDIPGLLSLADADILLLSVRRRVLPTKQMEQVAPMLLRENRWWEFALRATPFACATKNRQLGTTNGPTSIARCLVVFTTITMAMHWLRPFRWRRMPPRSNPRGRNAQRVYRLRLALPVHAVESVGPAVNGWTGGQPNGTGTGGVDECHSRWRACLLYVARPSRGLRDPGVRAVTPQWPFLGCQRFNPNETCRDDHGEDP